MSFPPKVALPALYLLCSSFFIRQQQRAGALRLGSNKGLLLPSSNNIPERYFFLAWSVCPHQEQREAPTVQDLARAPTVSFSSSARCSPCTLSFILLWSIVPLQKARYKESISIERLNLIQAVPILPCWDPPCGYPCYLVSAEWGCRYCLVQLNYSGRSLPRPL